MNFEEPTDENRDDWQTWVAERPDSVRGLIERRGFEPWKLYRMKSTGHRVSIAAFDEEEDGTITMRVNVTGKFNFVHFERCVFGINPEDLEECDLPDPGEPLGSLDISIEEAREMIKKSRASALS